MGQGVSNSGEAVGASIGYSADTATKSVNTAAEQFVDASLALQTFLQNESGVWREALTLLVTHCALEVFHRNDPALPNRVTRMFSTALLGGGLLLAGATVPQLWMHLYFNVFSVSCVLLVVSCVALALVALARWKPRYLPAARLPLYMLRVAIPSGVLAWVLPTSPYGALQYVHGGATEVRGWIDAAEALPVSENGTRRVADLFFRWKPVMHKHKYFDAYSREHHLVPARDDKVIVTNDFSPSFGVHNGDDDNGRSFGIGCHTDSSDAVAANSVEALMPPRGIATPMMVYVGEPFSALGALLIAVVVVQGIPNEADNA
jgi:hypothetical protein